MPEYESSKHMDILDNSARRWAYASALTVIGGVVMLRVLVGNGGYLWPVGIAAGAVVVWAIVEAIKYHFTMWHLAQVAGDREIMDLDGSWHFVSDRDPDDPRVV